MILKADDFHSMYFKFLRVSVMCCAAVRAEHVKGHTCWDAAAASPACDTWGAHIG